MIMRGQRPCSTTPMRYICKASTEVISKLNREIGSEPESLICSCVPKLVLVMIPKYCVHEARCAHRVGIREYRVHEAAYARGDTRVPRPRGNARGNTGVSRP
ncbi:hypothetical protein M0R45_016599 [Rubus argutus]|uniref:Uncharacterized protein n=1 Tax=Rubus argutus TaxID=59490 RepID=A0AAW1XTU3_RUBAR